MNPKAIRLQKTGAAFTLVEVLVVIAIMTVLTSLLLPALGRGHEMARVSKVREELYQIGLALDMYGSDTKNSFPPVRVNCNTDLATHWCELPVELAGYLNHDSAPGMAVDLEDVFNPQHTYKYAAPGPELLNGNANGNYSLWVPSNMVTMTGDGCYYTDPKLSPVRWVVWSLGPLPNGPKALDTYAPLNSESWYRRAGDTGVIARYADPAGRQCLTY